MGRTKGAVEDMVADLGFWRGRRVLVTGHTGFKGSWLLLILRQFGAEVTGYALAPPTTPSMFDTLGLTGHCRHVLGDVADLSALRAAFDAADPQVVIHMAAQPLVRASYEDPVGTYRTNVMGTVHVLEACRLAPSLESAVMVTTDKCYENYGWVWGYREGDRLGGHDPYSNSKAACELVVDAYRRSFFAAPADHPLPVIATARAGNVVGGGDFAADRLVPDAMRAFSNQGGVSIRNPLAVRPWQHVLEPLTGYLMLAEALVNDPTLAGGWNFGPATDEAASVGEVMDALVGLWGPSSRWVQDRGSHPHEATTLKLDSTKARLELGWKPRLRLIDALALTTEWYKAFEQGDDMTAKTLQQIDSYMELAS